MAYELTTLLLVPLGRAIAGWAQKALEDNKITWPEWKRLIKTVLKLGIPSIALYYGFEINAEIAAAIPIVADYLLSEIKELVLKNKK